MLDIGFLELMLIGVVGLLVLGPERLPRAARTAGMWIGKIKRTVSGMQREISAQLEAEELRQKLNEQQQKLDDSLKKAKLDVESIADAPAGADAMPSDTPSTQAAQSDTEQRVAKASARLDDALQTVREETPPPSSTPAPAAPAREAEPETAKPESAAPNTAESEKDRNHQ
ncbi:MULTISPECIES: Sec-independent protein translocase protein TatB [Halomonadaceae]|uniref:Sec-independent protein translocase protein TatB n=1 Tax=Vreelandella titanicae TaxID=664683 RepID=A0A558J985_9GAMM|nr:MULTISPECIES: Sec-independent protein translocase protein TatB [Halomonas]MBR9904031.1 twin-arginine translocase subunit TatB [Gammaproteobacteria bacterium]TVU90193.1 twin-arginine translocase subunit TatB [Halomonas titanicae]CEP34721.1 Sec-independent protein translocase protein TatB [Halomonas sp. R57-5]